MEGLTDRAFPHSLEAEAAVIGALLVRGDRWHEAAAVLRPEDFYREAHRLAYEAMGKVVGQGSTVDYLTVKDALGPEGLEKVGGPSYLLRLTDTPRGGDIATHARLVLEKARLRAAIRAGTEMVEAAFSASEPCADLVERGVQALLGLSAGDPAGSAPVGRIVQDYIVSLDDSTLSGTVVPTGFADVDELLAGGVRTEDLTIIAARPSVGKTAWATRMATLAARSGHPGAYFSLEMSKRALAERMISSEAGVDAHRMRTRMFAEADYYRLSQAAEGLGGLPLEINDDAGMTLTRLASACHLLKRRKEGLKFVVVDYLQMLSGGRYERRHDAVAAISRGLKAMAKQLGVAVIALSQLSRAPEGRTDKRPQLADLRESGALEQDADVAILLFREEMHKKDDEVKGIAECIVAKQRNGPTGVVRLAFLAEWAQFRDLAA